jgi:hypothetical protein
LLARKRTIQPMWPVVDGFDLKTLGGQVLRYQFAQLDIIIDYQYTIHIGQPRRRCGAIREALYDGTLFITDAAVNHIFQ